MMEKTSRKPEKTNTRHKGPIHTQQNDGNVRSTPSSTEDIELDDDGENGPKQ